MMLMQNEPAFPCKRPPERVPMPEVHRFPQLVRSAQEDLIVNPGEMKWYSMADVDRAVTVMLVNQGNDAAYGRKFVPDYRTFSQAITTFKSPPLAWLIHVGESTLVPTPHERAQCVFESEGLFVSKEWGDWVMTVIMTKGVVSIAPVGDRYKNCCVLWNHSTIPLSELPVAY